MRSNRSPRPGRLAVTIIPLLLAGAGLVTILGGCVPAAVGGAAVVATDRRSAGQMLDDSALDIEILNRVYAPESIDEDDRIKVVVYNGVVLLAGEVSSESNRAEAEAIAARVDGVRRVVNELEVMDDRSGWARFDDAWHSSRVNTALLTENPIEGFDATRIKVVTVRNTVYLMGLVSREEADAVTEVVRNVGGIERVVRVFDYTN